MDQHTWLGSGTQELTVRPKYLWVGVKSASCLCRKGREPTHDLRRSLRIHGTQWRWTCLAPFLEVNM